jgi:hypothetical protein
MGKEEAARQEWRRVLTEAPRTDENAVWACRMAEELLTRFP